MRLARRIGFALLAFVFFSLLLAGSALALSPTDGWKITLIPGTNKMLSSIEPQLPPGGATHSIPAPMMFDPEVAVDGNRIIYTALYDKSPQVYLYDIPTGEVTQLTNDQTVSFEQKQPQISGDWAAWVTNNGRGDIYLRNLADGEAKQFTPQALVVAWRLVGNRLAWEEAEGAGTGRLYLYDPAVSSVREIAAAAGLSCFDLDQQHLLWAGGPDGTELYLYDLAGGQTTKILQSPQPVESVAVKGEVVAWAERTGDRTTMLVYRLDTREKKTFDSFGPFNPELQTDGRYVVWSSGEEATGTKVNVYDTKTGQTIDLGAAGIQGSWPSIDKGRLAWVRFFPGRGREVTMVEDLATGLTTQLTNSAFGDQPPAVSGGHIVWARHNPDMGSSEGHGIFVATAPPTPLAPAFTDLTPNQLYRTAIEWLGEQGYASGYPGTSGPEFRAQAPLLRLQFCLLLVQVLGITVRDVPVHFGDLDTTKPGNPYEAQVMATLAQNGILQGTDQHLLVPRAPISRAQAVTLLVRALDYTHPGLLQPVPGTWVEPLFLDPIHGENVTRAGWDSLLDGLSGFSLSGWDIWAPASRGEGAQILWSTAGVYLEP